MKSFTKFTASKGGQSGRQPPSTLLNIAFYVPMPVVVLAIWAILAIRHTYFATWNEWVSVQADIDTRCAILLPITIFDRLKVRVSQPLDNGPRTSLWESGLHCPICWKMCATTTPEQLLPMD